ncbi:zinc ABC transporter ATP-binding protein AztA [Hoyosella sp. YIM 151337]|uniref:zinc ABC transporter ATP-binding protein AztA n=1 Tax=Hoyosella sp. YIM 151337 TaxID=2992742 RepID=UPI0022367F7C|nr:zinc ABC transporter ATP-binding protein AztA [Hoyosella sp. YIM 151337]MCW4352773.1 zinc ABC transporter ATP-binding protein AztA [Hoyosella sp. YIM 151337]
MFSAARGARSAAASQTAGFSPARSGPIVRAVGICVSFDGHRVLDGVDLTADAGAVTAVVGPNGSGKSTLLAVVAGLLAPHAGRLERTDNGDIALVPQRSSLPDQLPITVEELASMGRWRRAGLWRPLSKSDRAIVTEALDAVGLADLRKRPVGSLSGGQRQRALLAQGIAQRARLLLLDEPMTALDAASRAAVNAAVAFAAANGAAVVIVTHDLNEISKVDSVVELTTPARFERTA